MKNLNQFIKNTEEKTMFICCNDCYALNGLIKSDKYIVTTAFANIVSARTGFEASFFKHYLEQENVRQIIVAGHANCCMLSHIMDSNIEASYWQDTKEKLLQLESAFGSLSNGNKNSITKIMEYHIAIQINNLLKSPYFQILLEEFPISVKGIIIDDLNDSKVLEVDQQLAVGLPVNLN